MSRRFFRSGWIGFAAVVALLLASVTGLWASAQANDESGDEDAYANPDLLLDVAWLAEHLDDPQVVVVDVRPIRDYISSHVAGAVHVENEAVNVVVDGVIDQVADAETTASVLSEVGITPDKTIVIYDDDDRLYAARLFWILEYYGFPDVRLLDGGWPAWAASGEAVNSGPEAPTPADGLTLTANPSLFVDGAWLADNLENPDLRLIDARQERDYAGETGSGPRRGHIPGAANVDWQRNLADGFFLPPADLRALYADLDLNEAEQIIVYCTHGYRASVDYFALRLLGFENVAVYDGSWVEWAEHDEWPIEVGTP